MIESKKINVLIAIAVAFALAVSVWMVGYHVQSGSAGTAAVPEYATEIFGPDIISIEILADEDDWQNMLDNATSEEFICVDVIVNGTKFEKVGIRPKGNSSLTQIASSDSDRYSFRLQFDKYIEGQTCFGLDRMVVNNILGDNTYMKEYISYDIMKTAGVNCPYFGFSNITVNGEEWGLYLAVEMYSDSYLERTYGDTSGMLYNVKSRDMGNKEGGNQGGGPQGGPPSDRKEEEQTEKQTNGNQEQNTKVNEQKEEKTTTGTSQALQSESSKQDINTTDKNTGNGETQKQQLGDMGDGHGGGGMGGGSSGGTLEYTDDDSDSYSSIFTNAVGKSGETDYQRVIEALKALSTSTDLETYFDVDQILRYLAAHTVVVNLDSYSSNMAQNYYVYEQDGKVTILPWDYNLAWGGFQSSDADSVINFPIDTPVSGVEMSARPLLEKLFENTEYLNQYHQYLQEILDTYFANGQFEVKVNQLNNLISEYVKNDSTALCTYEEYQKGVEAFITLGNLRAESIQGQLDGTIPSTTQGQEENPDSLIQADDLNLRDLGSMGGGGKDGGPGGNMPDREVMEQAMKIIQESSGTLTEDAKTKLTELGLTEEQLQMFTNHNGENGKQSQGNGNTQNGSNKTEKDSQNQGPPQQNGNGSHNSEKNEIKLDTKTIVSTGIGVIVLLGGILWMAKMKKNY